MLKLVLGEIDAGQLVICAGVEDKGRRRRLRSVRELVVMCTGSSSSSSSSASSSSAASSSLSLLSISAASTSSPQHPLHAITHPASIDLRWYLHSHCKPAILPIFAPILPNAESVLFSEADTRIRAQSLSSSLNDAPAVGMLKFVTITTPCLVCGISCESRLGVS
jgi:hypothetical protein